MALLESLNLDLGTRLPTFSLEDPEGSVYSSETMMGVSGLMVIFSCNHCPYAIAVWERLVECAQYAQTLGIETVAINPNIHPDFPEDGPQYMVSLSQKYQFGFPYLVDDTQQVAKSYKAQCTPDIYVLDPQQTLVYHGRVDDNWKQPAQVTQYDLRNAITCLGNGEQNVSKQTPSMGCSIKWRPENIA